MRQYFLTIPKDYEEAAKLDGAGHFKTFWRVMLPLAAPAIAALTILQFQGTWNDFFWPLILFGQGNTAHLHRAARARAAAILTTDALAGRSWRGASSRSCRSSRSSSSSSATSSSGVVVRGGEGMMRVWPASARLAARLLRQLVAAAAGERGARDRARRSSASRPWPCTRRSCSSCSPGRSPRHSRTARSCSCATATSTFADARRAAPALARGPRARSGRRPPARLRAPRRRLLQPLLTALAARVPARLPPDPARRLPGRPLDARDRGARAGRSSR